MIPTIPKTTIDKHPIHPELRQDPEFAGVLEEFLGDFDDITFKLLIPVGATTGNRRR